MKKRLKNVWRNVSSIMKKNDKAGKLVAEMSEGKEYLRIEGGERLNPLQEALTALLKRQFSDQELMALIENEKDLRKILALDVLMEYIPTHARNFAIVDLLKDDSKADPVEKAAAYINGKKRIKKGELLKPAGPEFRKDAGFMEALKYANPDKIFFDAAQERRIKEARKNVKRKRKLVACLIIACILWLFSSFITNQRLIKDKEALIKNLRIQEERLEELSIRNDSLARKLEKKGDMNMKYWD